MRLSSGEGAPVQRPVALARRLGTSFAFLILLIVLVGGGSIALITLQDSKVGELTQRIAPMRDANVHLRNTAGDVQRSMRNYLLLGSPTDLRNYRRARAEVRTATRDLRSFRVEGTAPLVAREERRLEAYGRAVRRGESVPPGGSVAVKLAGELAGPFGNFRRANEALDSRLGEQVDVLRQETRNLVSVGLYGTGGLMVLAVLLASVTAVRSSRWITRPLEQVRRTVNRLAGGVHEARVPSVRPREIQDVGRSVNALADESDRLRAVEARRSQLGAAALNLSRTIRRELDVRTILTEAAAGIGAGVRATSVMILYAEEGQATVPTVKVWRAGPGVMPEEEAGKMPPVPSDVVPRTAGDEPTWRIDDIWPYVEEQRPLPGIGGAFGAEGMPAGVRAFLRSIGARAVTVCPFTAGTDVFGCVVLMRAAPGDVWQPLEVTTAEAMVLDLGRALHHARMYEKETRVVRELKELDRAKSEFLSTVSHELRTPLTSIVGYVELMLDEDAGQLTRHQRKALDVVERNTARLRAMIEDLLTLSRIESGAYKGVKQEVDVCGIVQAVADAMGPVARDKGVALGSACAHGALVAEADPDQLDRMLMNLTSNAVKFTPEGGSVTIRAARTGPDVELQVTDTGIGIPQAEQKHLFTRFFRASNASGLAVPGTGLGLTIVRTIVDNHGGELVIDSREDEGTTVTVRLPLAGAG